MVIAARARTEDGAHDVDFDIEPYLQQASEAQLHTLVVARFADQPALDAACFCERHDERLHALFEYVFAAFENTPHPVDVLVRINAADASRWLLAHRQPLASRLGLSEEPALF